LPNHFVVDERVLVAVGRERLGMLLGGGPRLEQKNAPIGIFGELRGDDGSRGASADDHVVEDVAHARPPTLRRSLPMPRSLPRRPGLYTSSTAAWMRAKSPSPTGNSLAGKCSGNRSSSTALT